MSSLLESLTSQLGGGALEGLSRQLGTDRKQTESGMAAALPLLLGALSRNSQSDEGAGALNSALDRDHDGSILSDAAGFISGGDTSIGAGILKHVLGGKQNRVQNGLAQTSGMDSATAGKMLTMLAPMVLGALGQAKRQNNLDASGLAGLLGQERQAAEKKSTQGANVMSMLLDTDGDGDVDLSDIAKHGGGFLGKLFGNK
jgi:hypothetical protein